MFSLPNSLRYYLTDSRWAWAVRGFPSVAAAGALFRVRRHTMTTPIRCKMLWHHSLALLSQNVPGALVECGVWKGGSAGIMGLALQHSGQVRDLHLFDSFAGLPEPIPEDGEKAQRYSGNRNAGELKTIDQCVAGLDEVKRFLFDDLGLDQAHVHFHVGWFQETLPKDAPSIEKIALLRLDGDWYESTRICLELLYPKLSSGGILVLDDYFAWEGCAKAADEYRLAHGIAEPLVRIDQDAAYWIKK